MPHLPVLGDLDAAGKPDLVVALNIIDEALERGEPARPPGKAAVQADIHHLRLARLPFRIEHVERILQIGVEGVAIAEPGLDSKAHVVDIQRIGNDQLVTPGMPTPIGKIVCIGIGNIVEQTGFGDEIDRVDRASSGIPAARFFPGYLFVDRNCLMNIGEFCLPRIVPVVDPFEPVGSYLPSCFLHRCHLHRRALQGGRHPVNGDGNARIAEQPVKPPETRPRAVFIDRFHVPMAHARPGLGIGDLGKKGLGRGIAMQNAVFAAFLVIDDELHGDCRAARPGGVGRRCAITQHVSQIAVQIGKLLTARCRPPYGSDHPFVIPFHYIIFKKTLKLVLARPALDLRRPRAN